MSIRNSTSEAQFYPNVLTIEEWEESKGALALQIASFFPKSAKVAITEQPDGYAIYLFGAPESNYKILTDDGELHFTLQQTLS